MAAPETTLRIKSINVAGLFGLYDHHVTLKEDRVTVIHGPNGVGKTVFLKLTNAFLRGQYGQIARIPFKTFEILFDDNSVARISIEETTGASKQMRLSLESPNRKPETSILKGGLLNANKVARRIAESSPYLSQIGPEDWVDRRTDEVLSADDVVARESQFGQKEERFASEPTGLRELRNRINIHLIEAQRLLRLSNNSREWRYRSTPEQLTTATVQEYSRDLKRQLESTLATYAKQSQKLDQSFPQRLLKGPVLQLSIGDLKVEMQGVEETRNKLKLIGVLDGGDSAQDTYPLQISQLDSLKPEQLSVMSVYARDTKAKLSVLEPLSERIEILLSVLNRKFINKEVTISRDSGLAIIGTDGNAIPVTDLSSGEQHELVLLYDLLFKVKTNTLVLIDEPELSLHISWQKGFMDDLLEIIRLAHFDVLLATHSPYIVGDRPDLLVVLSPGRED